MNRFGTGDALIDVVYPEAGGTLEGAPKEPEALTRARTQTLALLRELAVRRDGRHDASPTALRALPLERVASAFSPAPEILHVGDILFDTWALTSIRGELPGRPPVAPWLHGVTDDEPPETFVAWREEVEVLSEPSLRARHPPEDLLADYPLKPQELLRDRSDRVLKELEELAKAHPDREVWVLDPSAETVEVSSLSLLTRGDASSIAARIVILPPGVGGLREGLLNGRAQFEPDGTYDVADRWLGDDGLPRRIRVLGEKVPAQPGLRLVRVIELPPVSEDGEPDPEEMGPQLWRWFVRPDSADDDGSRSAVRAELLAHHLDTAARCAKALAERLLDGIEAEAVVRAAQWHDRGKNRRVWQRSIGNLDRSTVLAKSGPGMRPVEVSRYRHELGSLVDVSADPDFQRLSVELQDLVLHLIAAHHGRARPHFPPEEAFDPEHPDALTAAIVDEVPRRFARLQRQYGRWGLAYLESVMRAADILATQSIGHDLEGLADTVVREPA